MGGSFESGAGDDPNDLFANGDNSGEEEISEEDTAPPEERPESEVTEEATIDSDSHENADSESVTETGTMNEATETESPVMLEMESPADLDGAHLAREFVPNNYEKPHAWALGRDGVNDGRAEKKTFFLQSSVLDLEAACSQEVNEILDGNVPLTDLRELALILAYHQPELLAEAAREWGAESA